MLPLLPHRTLYLEMPELQTTRHEKKPIGYQRDGEHGSNGGDGGSGGGGGGNRGGGGSKNRSGGGGKQKKSSKDSKFGNKTARPDCYFCLGSHKASECPNRPASATKPVISHSQHGVLLDSVHTNLGAGLLVAPGARPALAARGAPRERYEYEYWVADSCATENATQGSSNLEDCTPPPQATR